MQKAAASRIHSLGELLLSQTPPVELLDLCRRVFKSRVASHEESSQSQIAYVFYLASICAALLRCNCRITRMSNAEIHRALQITRNYSWITPELRDLLNKTSQALPPPTAATDP